MEDDPQRALLAELLAEVRELRAAVRAGPTAAPAPTSDLTFAELVAKYFKAHTGAKWYQHRQYAMKAMLAHFGHRLVTSLRRADWFEYRDEVRAKQKTRMKGYPSIGQLNQEFAYMRIVMRWGVATERIAANPFDGVKKLKGTRSRETEIAPAALDAALDAAGTLLSSVYLIVCIETGMRASEVRLMEWPDIDEERRRIMIPWDRTKGAEGREVPVTEACWAALDRLPRNLTSPKVFVNPNTGDAYSKQHIWKLCRAVLDHLQAAPGDVRVRTHDARHSLVSRLVRAGMSTFGSMKIVGHKSASQHWRYTHINDSDRARAKELLDADRKAPRRSDDANAAPAVTTFQDSRKS